MSKLARHDHLRGTGEHILDDYYSLKELADEFGVSERTVARWDAQRTGPPRTLVGRTPYYRILGVRKWVAARERGPLRKPSRS